MGSFRSVIVNVLLYSNQAYPFLINTCMSEISFHEVTFTIAVNRNKFCTISSTRCSSLKPCLFVIEFLHTVSSTSVVTGSSWWAASIYSWNVTKFILKKLTQNWLSIYVHPWAYNNYSCYMPMWCVHRNLRLWQWATWGLDGVVLVMVKWSFG